MALITSRPRLGGAVDDHVIVMLFAGGEELVHRVLQQRVAIRHVGDLKFSATQIDGCGDHVEVVEIRARALDFRDALASFDDVIHRRLTGGVRGTQCRGGVALRIHINKQNLASETARAADRFTADVVLPTPPFWLATAIRRVWAGFGQTACSNALYRVDSSAICAPTGDVEPSKIRLMVSVADSIDVKLSGSSGPVMN